MNNKRLIKVLLLDLLIFIITLSYYELNKYYQIGIPCLFYKITGLYCPGCGITKLVFSIINFDFKKAFFFNPVVFILLPFLIAYFIYQEYIYIMNKKDKIFKKIPNFIYYFMVIILIIFGIFRNIL